MQRFVAQALPALGKVYHGVRDGLERKRCAAIPGPFIFLSENSHTRGVKSQATLRRRVGTHKGNLTAFPVMECGQLLNLRSCITCGQRPVPSGIHFARRPEVNRDDREP